MRIRRQFRLTEQRFEHRIGSLVYESFEHDYGRLRDDYQATGLEHILCVIDPTPGRCLWFTAPVTILEEHKPNRTVVLTHEEFVLVINTLVDRRAALTHNPPTADLAMIRTRSAALTSLINKVSP